MRLSKIEKNVTSRRACRVVCAGGAEGRGDARGARSSDQQERTVLPPRRQRTQVSTDPRTSAGFWLGGSMPGLSCKHSL